jgi:transposase
MVATKPVDFRKGAEKLAALVRETMTADPFSGGGLFIPDQAADQADLLGWHGPVPVRQTAGGRHLPLAEDRGRGHEIIGGAIVGVVGRAGLATRS